MRLAIISNLEHYRTPAGIVGAWPAAVREVDALAAQCDDVIQVACLHPGAPPAQALGYAARNVGFEWVFACGRSRSGGQARRRGVAARPSLGDRACLEGRRRSARALSLECCRRRPTADDAGPGTSAQVGEVHGRVARAFGREALLSAPALVAAVWADRSGGQRWRRERNARRHYVVQSVAEPGGSPDRRSCHKGQRRQGFLQVAERGPPRA